MADQLTDRIAEVLLHHRFDGDMYECSCQRDLPDNEVLAMDREEEHATHVAEAVVAALGLTEETLERIDDAIEDTLWMHEVVGYDHACSCGVKNNMDGDVLHGHRLGVLSDAVRGALPWVGVPGEEPQ